MALVGTISRAGKLTEWLGIAGVSDNDIVIETNDVSHLDVFELSSTAGAMDVFVSHDGVNFTTDPMSLADLGATSVNPVLLTAPVRRYGFRAAVKLIRIRQNNTTAVADAVLVGKAA